MRYVKKPIPIEAIQYTGTGENFEIVDDFANESLYTNDKGEIFVSTLEGDMKVSVGDYVIKGIKGEFYPCRKDIFEESYEPYDENKCGKTLDISEVKGAKKNISDLNVYGDGDTFALLCKASSEKEGWMKSTKVCNLPNGCLVQVTTQQRNPDGSYSVAEALSYVPSVNLDKTQEPRKLVPINREFFKNQFGNLEEKIDGIGYLKV